jgi:hypothetical protein
VPYDSKGRTKIEFKDDMLKRNRSCLDIRKLFSMCHSWQWAPVTSSGVGSATLVKYAFKPATARALASRSRLTVRWPLVSLKNRALLDRLLPGHGPFCLRDLVSVSL